MTPSVSPAKRRRRLAPAASPLGTVAVLLVYAAVYLKDAASPYVNPSYATFGVAAAMAIGFASMAARSVARGVHLQREALLVLTLFLIAQALSLALTGAPNLSSYYVAIPCAFVIVHTRPALFTRLMLAHFVLSLVIQAGEYMSGQYFFVYEAGDGTALDESLFGGSLDIFRAKGMFQGPLSAVAFALWFAFSRPRNLVAAAALLVSAFLASGRLGMLAALLLIVLRMPWRAKGGKRLPLAPMLMAVSAVAALAAMAVALSDETRLLFMASALDIENDQNVSRFYFWLTAASYYLSYSPIEMLLGNFGFILRQEGATENDFLRLLLDCGLAGALFYTVAIGALAYWAVKRRDTERLVIAATMVVLMNIFPFVQSLSSSLLFWFYVFTEAARYARTATVPKRLMAASPRVLPSPSAAKTVSHA